MPFDLPELEPHPFANLFPEMSAEAFGDFVEDIRRRGVLEPILLYDGKILDGRNRYRAAKQADVECPATIYTGHDPVGYVLSLNRRHLSTNPGASVAVETANSQRDVGSFDDVPTQAGVAKIFDISPRLVGEAIIEAFRSLSDYCRGMTPDRVFAPLSHAEGQDLRASMRFVRDWLDKAEPRIWKSSDANNPIPPIDRCAMHACELIFNFAEEMPREQWRELIRELRSQLDDVEKVLQPQGVRPTRFLSSVGYQQLNGAIGSINETVTRLLARRRH